MNQGLSGPLLGLLDWNYLAAKTGPSNIKSFTKGQKIVSRANMGDSIYFILSGEIQYSKRDVRGEIIKKAINRPYEYFGEQAVLNNKCSDATNEVWSETALVYEIPRETFLEAFRRNKTKFVQALLNTYRNLPPTVVQTLVDAGRINVYRALHSLITQGTQQQKVMLLVFGRAFLLRHSRVIGEISQGDFIGDIEFFGSHKNSYASVISENDCVTLEIGAEILESFLKTHKSFKYALARRAAHKLLPEVVESQIDPLSFYHYTFSQDIENESQRAILSVTRKLLAQCIESGCHDEDALEHLFRTLCSSLEKQQASDPRHYVSHGVTHSINALNYGLALLNGSATIQKDVADIFGLKTGEILFRLVALLHDIGYAEMEHEDITYKWEHQRLSANLVKSQVSYRLLRRVLPLSKEQYELFIEAIEHHGSDSRTARARKENRPFLITSNHKNPLLVMMRIADNLDLIAERLSKIQRDEDFLRIMKRIHSECLSIHNNRKLTDSERKILYIRSMRSIVAEELSALIGSVESNKLRELKANLMQIAEHADWRGYSHFQSIAISQNIFIREHVLNDRHKLTVYVEYNQPSSELPNNLIKFQTGRLTESVRHSVKLMDQFDRTISLEISQIFPNPRET